MVFVYIFAIMAILIIIGQIDDRKKRKCIHGILDGKLKNLCPICKIEKEEEDRIKAEKIKLKEISVFVPQLYYSEFKRLLQLRKRNINELLALTPNEFEDAIAELYSQMGYKVYQTPYTNDGGKDAIATKGNRKYLIECKRYDPKLAAIGRPMLQKFYAAIIEEKADKGFFVTTGWFADTAYEYVKKIDNQIELINGKKLFEMFEHTYGDSSDPLKFKQMCARCGDILEFPLTANETLKICVNGHEVKRIIPKGERKKRNGRY